MAVQADNGGDGCGPREVERAARACLAEGRPAEARGLLAAYLEKVPEAYELRCLLGYLFQHEGRYREAETCYETALAIAPPSRELFHNLGLVKLRLGDVAAARDYFAKALAVGGEVVETLDELAAACLQQGDVAGALGCYERLLKIDPHHVRAYVGMAEAFADAGWEADATRSFETALAIAPDDVEALNGLGIVCKRLGDYEQAMRLFERALALSPGEPALLRNKAMLCSLLGRQDEAEAIFRQLLARDPEDADAHFCLACTYLISGRFRDGWREYEYRWHSKERDGAVKMPTSALPRWSGQPVNEAGSGLVIYAEQGFGDGIQFARYVPLVAKRFSKILLHTRKPLLSLFRRSFAQYAEVVAEMPDERGYTHHCPLLSLPLAFDTRLETIPADFPYLMPDPGRIGRWRQCLAGERRLKVGIAWATGKRGLHKRSFELAPELLEPLFGAADVAWVSLNKEALDERQREILERNRVADWSAELADFDDTAALMCVLDLVISVDTAAAHLAGALDRPVWLLNRAESEWRWLLERSDSPWYRSMRIFRQQNPRQWEGVLHEVAGALGAWVAERQA
ncbi:MAG: tetratricopeptide repeat protein [Rhodocyclales bacterium]|nr:tetratricopeptide repeat protein [Rhodocyclales bacterium]